MDRRSFWNEASKYGLMLGVVMGASKIFEQSFVINANIEQIGFVLIEWLMFAVLFFAILYRATKKRAAAVDPALGYSFVQGVNYMMLLSVMAAIPVTCIYYVYVNSIIGYDNYIDGLVGVLTNASQMQQLDSITADTINTLIEQMRSQPQVSIFSLLFSTIIQYSFAGIFAGLILAGFISRKPEIPSVDDEE